MTTKRADKPTRFQPEIIDQLKDALKDAPEQPPKTELTKADVVRALHDEIKTLFERNYTLKQIAKLLRENGFSISLSSLRAYLKIEKNKNGENDNVPAASLAQKTPKVTTATNQGQDTPVKKDYTADIPE